MKSTSKLILLKDMDSLTISLLKKIAHQRLKEILKDKTFPFKVSHDINEWVVRADSNGDVVLLAPYYELQSIKSNSRLLV